MTVGAASDAIRVACGSVRNYSGTHTLRDSKVSGHVFEPSPAVLLSADLYMADLSNADMTGANFALSFNLGTTSWTSVAPTYDEVTDFSGTGFDPVAAGWIFVPEPSMAMMMNAGIVGLVAASRRRMRSSSNAAV